jgi:hypothetical protein
MINNQRRNFIFKSTVLAASGVLTACGGGGDPTLASAAGVDPVAPSDTEIAATIVTVPNGTALPNATFRLSGAATVRAAPYSLGYAFRRGDVPADKAVTGDTGTIQVIPKNRWPDGSLKFAVLAGLADVTAGADTKIGLMIIPTPTTVPTTLKTAKLRATEIVAEIGCGAYGTVSWSGADWDAPFQTWLAGPVMSSWIYRKPVGGDKHLVAWLEVRLWASGAVEVLPWIENGYLRVADPTNKSAIFTFMLGKTRRVSTAIDLKHHQRTPLINGTALSYWLAADPGVTGRQDSAYLQASELVPTYQAKVDAGNAVMQSLVTSYQPLQSGNFNYDNDNMASSGYQDPIGLLPRHDVLYLTSDAALTYGAVVRNAFSAGRYAIHYRDENTNRPLRFSSYPTLNIGDNQGFKDTGGSTTGSYTPTPTGGNAPGWDVAHSPSVGYLAYLVTGRWYFMEEVQFATTANYLGNGDNASLRTGSKGLVQPCTDCWQTRSTAWDWRARVQALCVTPDDDIALRSEFIASVEANIDHFHGRYVAKPNNPFGWIKPGEAYDGAIRLGSPWQQDFVTAAFGFSVSLGLPVSAAAVTKLNEFFQWKARSAVGRLGDNEAFWYVNAVPYNVMISPTQMPDYDNGTGPWYPSEAAVYEATYAAVPAWMGKVDGVLAAEYLPGERALWGNLLPAIAYAVRHGVPGADAAYARILAASNWPALCEAFNTQPVWSVQPAGYVAPTVPVVVAPVQPATTSGGTPAWMAGKPLNEWFEIPGTSGAGGAAVDAFSGMCVRDDTSEIFIALAGGHGQGYDNRVVSLDLRLNTPTWVTRKAASTVTANDVAYYPDGTPSSVHTYTNIHWIPRRNRVMTIGRNGTYPNSYTFTTVDGFNPDTNAWDAAGTWPDVPAGHYGFARGQNGDVWLSGSRWNQATATTTTFDSWLIYPHQPGAWDSLRNQVFILQFGNGQGFNPELGLMAYKMSSTGVQSTVTLNPSAALTALQNDAPTYSAMEYDPDNDRFLSYPGAKNTNIGNVPNPNPERVYVITPNSGSNWDVSILNLGAGSARPTATPSGGSGINARFRYVPALKGFVLLPQGSSNLFFIRTA